MSTFHLTISTPDGLLFDGEVQRVRARMIDGDVCLLAHHENYVSAVGAGEAALVTADGQTRTAACIGGMLTMIDNEATLIATTFEWADQIDLERAKRAKEVAQARISAAKNDKRELMLAEAKLQRALVRINVKR
ncbi:MAG TPA: ATP synthase F1 subunit epsilon [Candidatus Ventricola gallistercoris]|nr:ATP synthase F1 subunit epsilon [Candidatus Ventricola gallistercoris]